jgi:hypothetical protein
MDADLISLEAMLAARDAADWAFWTMLATLSSAFATLFAACVALYAIGGWKKQEKTREIKQLKLSIFRFQMKVLHSRPFFSNGIKGEDEVNETMQLLKELDVVYECTITMHNYKLSEQASLIYSDLICSFNDYAAGKISQDEMLDAIIQIRLDNPLLNSSI